jgi:hypothetical protein
MSPLGWYLVLIPTECAVIALVIWRVAQFGIFAAKQLQQATKANANALLELRAYVAGLRDLQHDHPVLPPDGLPDPVQEKEVA